MLHVRVICPEPATADVLNVFRAEPGATNVVRLTAAAVDPPGDLVQADVAREAVDGLLCRLQDLGVEETGSIVILDVDTALGREIERAERDAPGEGDDAVVWEQLTALTLGRSNASVSFLVFLVLATMIAAVGLLIDSQVLIVGAMVLGPEFGPVAGLAVAVVRRRWHDVLQPLRALTVGFTLAIVVTALGVLALEVTDQIPQAFLDGNRPLTSFVAAPDIFSVIVAILAGIAGTLSLTGDKSSPLVGVFISVTTVPAAANIAAGLAVAHFDTVAGATAQLLLNLAFILASAVATLQVQRRLWRHTHAPSIPDGPPSTTHHTTSTRH